MAPVPVRSTGGLPHRSNSRVNESSVHVESSLLANGVVTSSVTASTPVSDLSDATTAFSCAYCASTNLSANDAVRCGHCKSWQHAPCIKKYLAQCSNCKFIMDANEPKSVVAQTKVAKTARAQKSKNELLQSYYHQFTANIASSSSKRKTLNSRAAEQVWMPNYELLDSGTWMSPKNKQTSKQLDVSDDAPLASAEPAAQLKPVDGTTFAADHTAKKKTYLTDNKQPGAPQHNNNKKKAVNVDSTNASCSISKSSRRQMIIQRCSDDTDCASQWNSIWRRHEFMTKRVSNLGWLDTRLEANSNPQRSSNSCPTECVDSNDPLYMEHAGTLIAELCSDGNSKVDPWSDVVRAQQVLRKLLQDFSNQHKKPLPIPPSAHMAEQITSMQDECAAHVLSSDER